MEISSFPRLSAQIDVEQGNRASEDVTVPEAQSPVSIATTDVDQTKESTYSVGEESVRYNSELTLRVQQDMMYIF